MFNTESPISEGGTLGGEPEVTQELSLNAGEWADQINGLPKNQLELLLQLATQRLEKMDLRESTIGSPKERRKEESDERFPSPRNGDGLFESPRKIEDESPYCSPACWIDLDESWLLTRIPELQ